MANAIMCITYETMRVIHGRMQSKYNVKCSLKKLTHSLLLYIIQKESKAFSRNIQYNYVVIYIYLCECVRVQREKNSAVAKPMNYYHM